MNIQAELISIGNELLSGQTLNTHARDLGEALATIGLQLIRDTTIPDDIPTIASALREALGRTPLVFISGGLGPTTDDITREALSSFLGRKILLDAPTVETITQRYAARGRTMTPAAERQARVLEGATVLPNSAGAAPGQRIELLKEKNLWVLPGPPNEFNAILNEEIVPWLKQRFPNARPLSTRTILTTGIGESDIATLLEKVAFQPAKVALGFYPGKGQVRIRLTADPDHENEVVAAEQSLRSLLFDFLDSNH